MVDGINELSGFPLLAIDGRHGRGSRYGPAAEDSRECPGPISEATLLYPSARRVLTAGAIALAAVAPAIDPNESTADSTRALPPLTPVRVESVALDTDAAFLARTGPLRASRSATRRTVPTRPTARQVFRHPAILAAVRTANIAVIGVARETGLGQETDSRQGTVSRRGTALTREAGLTREPGLREPQRAAQGRSRAPRSTLARRVAHAARPSVRARDTYRAVVTRHAQVARTTSRVALGGGMTAVIAYARSQVGRSYVTGGEGGSGFDCSGLTRRAYARAGIRLPHSSRAQAARAHTISRRVARAGDLVVGSGHVGIYMGRGMMIDAGNHRTGVVYRKLYSGLRVERF
jgi:cell wall-associated NlpC family hydrolase